LPEGYDIDRNTNYPVVYLLDANFHFPALAPAIKQYEKGGLLPHIILVGIGYKSFQPMDSLRVRDYLFPAGLPSGDLNAAGGGQNFDRFIKDELLPGIDSTYRTDKTNHSLLGHTFGGYFSLYSLLNQAATNGRTFKNFAAASPSLWYNNSYLKQLAGKLKIRSNTNTLNIYMTVGGRENDERNIQPVRPLGQDITKENIKGINFQYKVLSELGHLDVANIPFIKSLQSFYPLKE
jgi:predicted alpha/beta superfamily hydrolase